MPDFSWCGIQVADRAGIEKDKRLETIKPGAGGVDRKGKFQLADQAEVSLGLVETVSAQ
ncbi:hypothetical protein LAB1_30460 [Roseibium sp. LAB1]